VKIAGLLGGDLELEQIGEILKVKSGAQVGEEELLEIARLETGLWHGPYEDCLRPLPPSVRPILEALGEAHPGLRLPIAPLDFEMILIAVSLSKRADYERRVLAWCRGIWEAYGGDIRRLCSAPLSELRGIGSSHQVLGLQRTLKSFLGLEERLPGEILERFGAPEGSIVAYIGAPARAREDRPDKRLLGPRPQNGRLAHTIHPQGPPFRAVRFASPIRGLQARAPREGGDDAKGRSMLKVRLRSRAIEALRDRALPENRLLPKAVIDGAARGSRRMVPNARVYPRQGLLQGLEPQMPRMPNQALLPQPLPPHLILWKGAFICPSAQFPQS